MKTTPQSDVADGTKTEGKTDETPKTVIVDPALIAEADAAKAGASGATPATATVTETTETTPVVPPVADAASATAGAPVAGPNADANGDAGGHATVTDKAAETGKNDEEPQLPVNDGRVWKYGLAAAAILGTIALFVVAFSVVRNTAAGSPNVIVPASPAAPAAPAAPLSTLPEVRTPAPRLIDATGCRRGQYRIEGNQLVFTNCATLELAEPPAR